MVWLSRRDLEGEVTGNVVLGQLGADMHVDGSFRMGKTAKTFAPHVSVYKGSS